MSANKLNINQENKMKTKENVKAGGSCLNHNQSGVAVKSAVKADGLSAQHNQSGLDTKIISKPWYFAPLVHALRDESGRAASTPTEKTIMKLKTNVKAGQSCYGCGYYNHNQTMALRLKSNPVQNPTAIVPR